MTVMMKKGLLFSGILAPLVRIAADILAGIRYPGYSFRDQTMSQLAAIGAPTLKFQLVLLALFAALVAAFGAGIWLSGEKRPSIKTSGLLMALFGIAGLLSLAFPQAAMQLGGDMAAQLVHIVVISASVVLIILFIAFGAAAHGRGFRLYSVSTVIVMLLFGCLTAAKAPHAVDYAAPGMGILERASYYSYLIWIMVFAWLRLRSLESPRA